LQWLAAKEKDLLSAVFSFGGDLFLNTEIVLSIKLIVL